MQSVQILTKSCWLLTADLELLLEMLADDVTAEDVGEEDSGLFLGTSTLKCNVRWRLLEEGGEEGGKHLHKYGHFKVACHNAPFAN